MTDTARLAKLEAAAVELCDALLLHLLELPMPRSVFVELIDRMRRVNKYVEHRSGLYWSKATPGLVVSPEIDVHGAARLACRCGEPVTMRISPTKDGEEWISVCAGCEALLAAARARMSVLIKRYYGDVNPSAVTTGDVDVEAIDDGPHEPYVDTTPRAAPGEDDLT